MRNIKYIVISKKGKREINEDSIFPFNKEPDTIKLFIVCDGVGGAQRGEVASQLVCDTIVEFFNNNVPDNNLSEVAVSKAISLSENRLRGYLKENSGADGMSTTLALLNIQNQGILVAHAGDSRVYHIRDGKILFVTKDHSLVNELIVTGYITEEEAKTHANRNVITKAIGGTDKHTLADVTFLTDIQPGDFFMLCSDGVLEGIDEQFICANFKLKDDELSGNSYELLESIISRIDNNCSIQSNDNYSAIVVQVFDTDPELIKVTDKNETEIPSPSGNIENEVVQNSETYPDTSIELSPARSKKSPLVIAILILIIIAIAILLYYVLSIKSEKSPNKTKKVTGRVINIHSNKMLNDIKVNSFVLLRKFSDNSQTI